MKKITIFLILCQIFLSCKKNDIPKGNSNGNVNPTNSESSITFENNSFTGSCIVTYSDGAKYNGMFANGTMTIPKTGANKVIASIQPQNQQLLIIGRKEGFKINLNYNGNVLAHRTVVNGYVPIGTFAEFQLINKNSTTLAASYKQEAYLNFMNNVWVPIGTSTSPFIGTFDGNNFEIDQLNVISDNFAGLFGFGSSNSNLLNIILKSGIVKGGVYAAGIAAQCGNIVNCKNYAKIESDYAAGVVANCDYISNCENHSSVKGLNVAGVALTINASSGEILNCHNFGIVESIGKGGSFNSSGVFMYANNVNIKDCSNNNLIKGFIVCGITFSAMNIQNCINNSVLSPTFSASGIVQSALYVKNCKNNGEILKYDTSSINGILCGISSNSTNIEDCINTAFINAWRASECFGIGYSRYGTIKNCNNSGKIFGYNGINAIKLMGIGIAKYFINCHNTGEIEAQSISQSSNQACSCSGIGGDVNTVTVSNCSNTGKISMINGFYGLASGIISSNESPIKCTITGCFNTGEIMSGSRLSYCGGISAYLNGNISKCYNTGSITSLNGSAGGISARLNDPSFSTNCNVSDCYNTGYISGNLLIDNNYPYIILSGGIVGSTSGNISRCFNSGNVSCSVSGGICGFIYNDDNTNNIEINSCYNTGTITGQRNGGILGEFLRVPFRHSLKIKNCYNTGNSNAGILNLDGSTPIVESFTLENSFWKQGTATYAIVSQLMPSSNVGANLFSGIAWPSAASGWNTTDWKSLGSWNNGNPIYPKLIFEN